MRSSCLLSTLIAACTALAAQALHAKPNVIVFFADDMGYADVGVQGAKYPTPHLDKLAQDGTRFSRFYVSNPVCSPSRAALLTGCYPQRFGIHRAIHPTANFGLNNTVPTLPSLFKQQGYATGIFGKWHLGSKPGTTPTDHGFDEFLGTIVSHDYDYPADKTEKIPLVTGPKREIVLRNPKPSELTRRCTEGALQFLDKHAKENFFLYVPYNLPHVPLGVSPKNKDSSKTGLYGDVMRDIDDSVGAILAKIDTLGLRDNTLVIFSSDNGPWSRYGNHAGSALPFRQGKGTVYEGGIRVPFFIRWPGKIPSGRVSDTPFCGIDILPSLSVPVGYPIPTTVDGSNLWPLLTGATDRNNNDTYWFSYGGPVHAVMRGKWKLVVPHNIQVYVPEKNGRDGSKGQVEHRKITKPELYDLVADPSETQDIAAKTPDIVRELNQLAQQAPWRKDKAQAK